MVTPATFIKKYTILFYRFIVADSIYSLVTYRPVDVIGNFFNVLSRFYVDGHYKRSSISSTAPVFENLEQAIKLAYPKACLVDDNDIEVMLKSLHDIPEEHFTDIFIDKCDELHESLFNLFSAYKRLSSISPRFTLKSIMYEFFDTMSHIIVSIAQNGCQNEDYRSNIRRATSHLNRATKDVYKVLIHAYFHTEGFILNEDENEFSEYIKTRIYEVLSFGILGRKRDIIKQLRETEKKIYERCILKISTKDKIIETLNKHNPHGQKNL